MADAKNMGATGQMRGGDDMLHTREYGSWPSPIDAALAAAHDGQPEYVGFVGAEAWWTEPRPTEAGRRALVRRLADGTERSVLPAPWNVRSRVIEYGGRPWAGAERPVGGPLVVFVNFTDQRLYAYEPDAPGAEPRPLTPVSDLGGGLRWVDPQLHVERGEVWCVLEEFTGEGPGDLRRLVAAVPLDGSAAEDRAAVRELTDDAHRFVTTARLSPDGRRAAWIAWDHPRMPWDGTELLLADVADDGSFGPARTVAGGVEESVCQVEWAFDGGLLYSGDRSGWWNLYRLDVQSAPAPGGPQDPGALPGLLTRERPLCARDEEFGGPMWKLGLSWFKPLEAGLIAVVHGVGATALGILDPETGEVVDTAGPWTAWSATLAVHGSRVVGVAASPRTAPEVVELDTGTGHTRVIGAAHDDPVDPAYYPEPQIRTFGGPDGRDVHAHIYPPHSPTHVAPDDELPPYVVWAHGGPTSHAPSYSTWRSPTSPRAASASRRSTTAGPPDTGGSTGTGCASSGAWSTSRTARPSRSPSPRRAPPTASGSPSAAAAPGLDQCGIPDQHGRLRLRHDHLSHPRPHRLGRGGDPRLRVPVPGVARRPARRGARALRGALAGRARRPPLGPVPAPPGPRRRDLPARPVRAVP